MNVLPVDINGKTVISTFAGCGGSSLGYKMAGYKELLAIKWEDNAVQTFKLNFPDVPVWQRDIKSVTAQEIFDYTGLKKGELFLFDGSPPCQGFSTAGKRQLKDERNDLFKDYCRLLSELQPKVFVMENVSGMIKGKMKGKFLEILQALKDCGYNVKCKLMNAMWYDVPQSRERVIFIGIRNDLGLEPSFPKPKKTFITVGAAIKGLNKSDAPALSPLFKRYWHQAGQGGSLGKFNSSKRLKENEVCPTLTKSEGYGGVYHPTECRPLSSSERKRLASYPDSFIFNDWKNAIERIGNSVPPNLMKAIAKHILTIFEDKTDEKQTHGVSA